jgi:nicotinamide riboside kinase
MAYHDGYIAHQDNNEFKKQQRLNNLPKPKNFIIEGIDRLGKSTLVNNLLNTLGYHLVIHYSKPLLLEAYNGDLKTYQRELNLHMAGLLEKNENIIFDRGMLGEKVYAPLYRDYSGDYVEMIFKSYVSPRKLDQTKLILLTTSNFDLCVDDGESFNFDNKHIEQEAFLSAFNDMNMFLNRTIIDVHNGEGGFKKPEQILQEALNNNNLELK